MPTIVDASDGAFVLDDGRRVALLDTHGWQLVGDERCEIDGGDALWTVARDAQPRVIAQIDALKGRWPADVRAIGHRRVDTGLTGDDRAVSIEVVRILRDVDALWPERVAHAGFRVRASGFTDATTWTSIRAHRGALPGCAARFELGGDAGALAVELTCGGSGNSLRGGDGARDEIEVKILMADTRMRFFDDDTAAAVNVARGLAAERIAVVHDLDDAWWCPVRPDGSLELVHVPDALRARATTTSWTTLPPLVHSAHATFNRRARPEELAALRARDRPSLGERAVRAVLESLIDGALRTWRNR